MPEADYNRLIKHMERLLDQKGMVHTDTLKELVEKLQIVQQDISRLQVDMRDLATTVDKAVLTLNFQDQTHERRLSLVEKIVLGTVTTILLTVLGAVMANVVR